MVICYFLLATIKPIDESVRYYWIHTCKQSFSILVSFTDIQSVSPNMGSNQGGTKISITLNAGPLTDYPREDIKVYVGGKGMHTVDQNNHKQRVLQ